MLHEGPRFPRPPAPIHRPTALLDSRRDIHRPHDYASDPACTAPALFTVAPREQRRFRRRCIGFVPYIGLRSDKARRQQRDAVCSDKAFVHYQDETRVRTSEICMFRQSIAHAPEYVFIALSIRLLPKSSSCPL